MLKNLWQKVSLTVNVSATLRHSTAKQKKARVSRQEKSLSKGTIWHVLFNFDKEEGQASWAAVKQQLDASDELALSWLEEDNRGLFFETPLHIAMLNYRPTKEYTKFFIELWDRCPDEVREAEYDGIFEGENVLHIAIVKKVGIEIITEMVQSNPKLLDSRARGKFFTDEAMTSGGCNNLGEYNLSFAACTNQYDIFKFLLESKADISRCTTTGNNILHLMALNAINRASVIADNGDEFSDAITEQSNFVKQPDVEAVFMTMYDKILNSPSEFEHDDPALSKELKRKIKALHTMENNEGFTPLTLAAARGSLAFFNHVFNMQIFTEWTYGPVSGKRLYLDGIGFPMPHSPPSDAKQGDPEKSDPKKGEPKQSDPKQGDPNKGDPKQNDPKQSGQNKDGGEPSSKAVDRPADTHTEAPTRRKESRAPHSGLTVLQVLVQYSQGNSCVRAQEKSRMRA
jgi:hypothetical protein